MLASNAGPFAMAPKETSKSKTTYAGVSAFESVQGYNGIAGIPPPMTGGGAFGPQSAAAVYNQIHETAAKRIQTLDYLRKALVLSPSSSIKLSFSTIYACPNILPHPIPLLLNSFSLKVQLVI